MSSDKEQVASIRYPLLFRYKDYVAGSGFLACVEISGRALMIQEAGEDDEWWMYGVRPSAIAENGKTPQETSFRFRERYKRVLYDFATDAADIDQLETEVREFFNDSEETIERQWTDAFRLIHEGDVEPEEPFASLPKKSPEQNEPEISVVEIEPSKSSPSDNLPPSVFQEHPELLAA